MTNNANKRAESNEVEAETDSDNNESTDNLGISQESLQQINNLVENKTPDEVDVEFHFSNDFIDSMYSTLENIASLKEEIESYNKSHPNKKQRKYIFRSEQVDYPTHDPRQNVTKKINFKRKVQNGNFRINTENKLLLYMRVGQKKNVKKTTLQIVPRQEQLKGVWIEGHKHHGLNVTEHSIAMHWKIKSMRKWIEKRMELCKCKENVPKRPKKSVVGKAALKIPTLPCAVMETVHWDLSGPYPETEAGNKYVAHMVDAYSSFCVVVPIIQKMVEENVSGGRIRY